VTSGTCHLANDRLVQEKNRNISEKKIEVAAARKLITNPDIAVMADAPAQPQQDARNLFPVLSRTLVFVARAQ
jgi:hypothetical protein